MTNLGEVHAALFGERPAAHVFYGESPQRSLIEILIQEDGILNVPNPDIGPGLTHGIANGFHPILVMSYRRPFDRDVSGAKLSDYLERIPDPSDFSQKLALADSEEVMRVFLRFIEEMNFRGAFSVRDDEETYFICPVSAGQRLVTVTFGLEPVPGCPVAA